MSNLSDKERKRKNADYQKEYRKKYRMRYKGYDLKRFFGITLDEYNVLLENQGNVCAICRNPETITNKQGTLWNLAVDHSHLTGKVRGLLCSRCNQGIGNFRENPDFLLAAIAYLKKVNPT